MRTVGLKTLKDRLSEYVRLAAAGETVVITDRGRPVARLAPSPERKESVVERGIREGWITPAKKPSPPLPPRLPAITSLEEVLRELDQDREDR